MGTIREDVFLGTAEKYNQKLEMLAKMAQPEKWTYKKIQDIDPHFRQLGNQKETLMVEIPTVASPSRLFGVLYQQHLSKIF